MDAARADFCSGRQSQAASTAAMWIQVFVRVNRQFSARAEHIQLARHLVKSLGLRVGVTGHSKCCGHTF